MVDDASKEKTPEGYKPEDVKKDRNTRKEIIKYLTLVGLKCVKDCDEKKDEKENEEKEKSDEEEEFDDNDEIILYYRDIIDDEGDEEESDEEKKEELCEIRKKKINWGIMKQYYGWVDNYDSFLYMMDDYPLVEEKKEENDALKVKLTFRKKDQFERGEDNRNAPMDFFFNKDSINRQKFYAFVNQLQNGHEKEINESSAMDLYTADYDPGPIEDEYFEGTFRVNMCTIDDLGNIFENHGIVFKIGKRYFDITEFFSWLHADENNDEVSKGGKEEDYYYMKFDKKLQEEFKEDEHLKKYDNKRKKFLPTFGGEKGLKQHIISNFTVESEDVGSSDAGSGVYEKVLYPINLKGMGKEEKKQKGSINQNLIINFYPRYSGDMIIIQIPDQNSKSQDDANYTNILIDCSWYTKSRTKRFLREQLGIEEIHYIIVSHADADHCRRIKDLFNDLCLSKEIGPEAISNDLKNSYLGGGTKLSSVKGLKLNVKKVFLPSVDKDYNSAQFNLFKRHVESIEKSFDIKLIEYPSEQAGAHGIVGNFGHKKFQLTFLGPSKNSDLFKEMMKKSKMSSHDYNNSSLVFLIEWGENNFLFPGDAEEELWLELFKSNAIHDLKNLKLLKLAHHGSDNGTPEGIARHVDFRSDSFAVATRHLSNGGRSGLTNLYPKQGVIDVLLTKKKDFVPLSNRTKLHSFDHDQKEIFSSKETPPPPFLYTYHCNHNVSAEEENTWAIRFFFKDDVKEDKENYEQIGDSVYSRLKEGNLVFENDKFKFTGGKSAGLVKRNNNIKRSDEDSIMKVMLTWLNSQLT
ncbi:MAG: hypothetical protein ACFFDT_20125 [Candidatus Hodarchaeota archaeon]